MIEHKHPAQKHVRHIKYVDENLQLRLLVALVLFELLLTALGTGYLYLEFSKILEEQLYSVHLSTDGGYAGLMERVLYVLAGITVVNIAMLLVVDRFWLGQVNGLMLKLDQYIGKLIRLDFTRTNIPPSDHRLLDLLSRWFEKERQIQVQLRENIGTLSTGLTALSEKDRPDIVKDVDELLLALKR